MIPYEVVSAMSISVINDKVALLYFIFYLKALYIL